MTAKRKPKIRRRRQVAHIYYGPPGFETSMYWTVAVTDAKKEITITGTAAAALRAHHGVTIGCALSLVGMDNADEFGHDVFFVSVTKSTLLAVDRLNKAGLPVHAVRYAHSYSRIVDQNDDRSLKKLVEANPEIMERPFVLRLPRKRPTGTHKNHKRKVTHTTRYHIAKYTGALARAVKAGRIGEHVAQQLSQAMSKRKPKQLELTEG